MKHVISYILAEKYLDLIEDYFGENIFAPCTLTIDSRILNVKVMQFLPPASPHHIVLELIIAKEDVSALPRNFFLPQEANFSFKVIDKSWNSWLSIQCSLIHINYIRILITIQEKNEIKIEKV